MCTPVLTISMDLGMAEMQVTTSQVTNTKQACAGTLSMKHTYFHYSFMQLFTKRRDITLHIFARFFVFVDVFSSKTASDAKATRHSNCLDNSYDNLIPCENPFDDYRKQ